MPSTPVSASATRADPVMPLATLERPGERGARRGSVMAGWPDRLLDALGALCCVLCNATGAMLCDACRSDAALDGNDACRRCALPLSRGAAATRLCGRCLRKSPAYDATHAFALYAAPFDQLVRGLKYRATLAYAPLLASLLVTCLPPEPPFDALLPVPLSRARMAERGFNQSIEVARALSRLTRIPLWTDGVLRIVDTLPQASLPFDERRSNLRGAFAVVDTHRDRIAGRRIAVVDDVMTTGATLDELAHTLKRAGAATVTNLVVARTP